MKKLSLEKMSNVEGGIDWYCAAGLAAAIGGTAYGSTEMYIMSQIWFNGPGAGCPSVQ